MSDEGHPPKQQQVMHKLVNASFVKLQQESQGIGRARLNAFSAPGSGRWMNATPSKTLDKHLGSQQLYTSVAARLGVDVYDSEVSCFYCGEVVDKLGLHCQSCTAGGDIVVRHNDLRNLLYHFAKRGRLRPELEKAGLLQEDAIIVNLRRPADVLVDGNSSSDGAGSVRRFLKTAWDVKVINSLGQGHLDATLQGSTLAAEAYRMQQLEHLNTASLCAEKGINYVPLVFTTQGGIERHAEATLGQLAEAVAKAEEKEAGVVKSDLLEQISLSIARSVHNSVRKRCLSRFEGVLHCQSIRQILEDGEHWQ